MRGLAALFQAVLAAAVDELTLGYTGPEVDDRISILEQALTDFREDLSASTADLGQELRSRLAEVEKLFEAAFRRLCQGVEEACLESLAWVHQDVEAASFCFAEAALAMEELNREPTVYCVL